MKEYLIGFFQFNDRANRKVLDVIVTLPDKSEPTRLLGHLVNCLHKWLNRITEEVPDSSLSWNQPAHTLEECKSLWELYTGKWITLLKSLPEARLNKNIPYKSSDGGKFSSTIEDIALQLNYHAIHHRAQIMTMIRQQGLTPPVVDYIFLNRKTL